MRNNLFKLASFCLAFFAFAGFSAITTSAASECKINGRAVPCDQMVDQIKDFGLLALIPVLILIGITVWAIIFWILMLIHAIRHDVKDRALWIIILLFAGIIGAIIYYYVVKRKYIAPTIAPGIPKPPIEPAPPSQPV